MKPETYITSLKKILIIILQFTLCFTLAACTSKVPDNSKTKEVIQEKDDTKTIVIYFSATGNTKTVAEKIQSMTNSDIYRIEPAIPYTEDDLNYNDDNSRTTKEQNDSDARPEIGSDEIDLDSYDIIYLGYCIWWGQAPKIMYTFVETYSFEGKTVYPFITSSSSSIGTSATNLEKAAKSGTWKEGTRFETTCSESDIQEWLDQE